MTGFLLVLGIIAVACLLDVFWVRRMRRVPVRGRHTTTARFLGRRR